MAYEFTAASSQYLSTVSTPANAGPVTMSCWAYPTTANTVSIMAIDQSNGSHRFALTLLSSTFNPAQRARAQSQIASIDSTTQYNINEWNHVCGIFDDTTIKRSIWLNGGGNATSTSTDVTSGKNRILIGARTASGAIGVYFGGMIAEVGIWNAALTAAEVASLAKGMTCDKIRPQSLVFYAPLVRNLQDAKGGLTITNNNGATVATHPRVYA